MSSLAAGTPVVGRVRASVGVFVTLAGLTCGLTILFLAMRKVMEIGGVCADGGPFVSRQPCPKGIPILMIGSIWGGLLFCGLYAWQTVKNQVPSLLALAWPALFLSLGWNFLEFGVNPPGEEGLVWGWLVCAGLFILMGGGPLLIAVRPLIRNFTRDDEPQPGFRTVVGEPLEMLKNVSAATKRSRSQYKGESPSSGPERRGSSGFVGELERLAALHRSGALGDDEYAAAKRLLLEDGS